MLAILSDLLAGTAQVERRRKEAFAAILIQVKRQFITVRLALMTTAGHDVTVTPLLRLCGRRRLDASWP